MFIYFLYFKLVNESKARLPSKVPGGWLSESYLTRCLERKGGEEKGTVKSFRSKWAREGVREVFYLSFF